MLILAIESSCDETAAAVVTDGRTIVSSVIHSQVAEHGLYGGVVPEIASRRHIQNIVPVVQSALDKAQASVYELDAVAVTAAPGLIGALLVGINYAKGLAFAAQKPLVPVHHIRGHIASNYLAYPQLEPPFLCLVASGGHSHIVEVLDYTTFRVVGRTRDDAAGEAFDKVARVMGLGYPGGPAIDTAARGGDPNAYSLPRPKVSGSDYDFSFSGLKTAVINLAHNAGQKGEALDIAGLAASFQCAATDMLCDHLLLAARRLGYKQIAVAGGVAANSALRAQLEGACRAKTLELFLPPLSLCGDNAAMIGSQAYYEYKAGYTAGIDLNGTATADISLPLVPIHM